MRSSENVFGNVFIVSLALYFSSISFSVRNAICNTAESFPPFWGFFCGNKFQDFLSPCMAIPIIVDLSAEFVRLKADR